MATYRNGTLLNSPSTNNNTNNNNSNTIRHPQHLSSTLSRDLHDLSLEKYHSSDDYKSMTMPKTQYQTMPNTNKDLMGTDQGSTYSSESSSFDADTSSNANEASKRLNSNNGKFSIQKIFRQGFSSWRTRKKPAALSTPPLPSNAPNNGVYSSTTTPSQPPLSSTRYATNQDDLSLTSSPLVAPPPPPTHRSISVDSISNTITSPSRIIVTEPVTIASPRSNSVDSITVDFDRPATHTRSYIPSNWTHSTTSGSNLNKSTSPPPPPPSLATTINVTNTTNMISSTVEPTSHLSPITTNRTLPVQFTETTRPITSPRSVLPPPPPPITQNLISSVTVSSPMQSSVSNATKANESGSSSNTTSNTTVTNNSVKIPPPGK